MIIVSVICAFSFTKINSDLWKNYNDERPLGFQFWKVIASVTALNDFVSDCLYVITVEWQLQWMQ